MEDGRRILRIILNILIPLGIIALVCLLGPWLIRFFMPFVIGWCIAMIANPLVRFLEKRLKLVRRHSSVLIVVFVLAVVIGGIYFLISKLTIQIVSLVRDLPAIYEAGKEEVQSAFLTFSHLFERLPQNVQDSITQFSENLGTLAGNLASRIAFPTVTAAGNVARGIPAALVYSIVVIFSSYFFSVDFGNFLVRCAKWGPRIYGLPETGYETAYRRLFFSPVSYYVCCGSDFSCRFFGTGRKVWIGICYVNCIFRFFAFIWDRNGSFSMGVSEAFIRRMGVCCGIGSAVSVDSGGAADYSA